MIPCSCGKRPEAVSRTGRISKACIILHALTLFRYFFVPYLFFRDAHRVPVDPVIEVRYGILQRKQHVVQRRAFFEGGREVPFQFQFGRQVDFHTGVNIGANFVGVPAEGYQVESVTTVPDTVSIAGTDEALDTLKQNDNILWIGGADIDITGETADIEKKVSLKDALPDDVKLTSGTSEDVWVKVSILPLDSHSYGLPSNQVKVNNLDDNLLVTFGTDKIEIRVKATDGNLDEFDIEKVEASVDLSDMSVGSYQIPVTVKLPEGFELLDNVVADVTISEITNADSNNG